MEKLFIESNKETPEIKFDGDKGFFSIAGKSYPENVNVFYKPIFEYIDLYKPNSSEKIVIEFNWLYYNTATSKIIVKIILSLKEIGNEMEINWYYKKDFDLIADKGKEIKEILDVNLNLIEL